MRRFDCAIARSVLRWSAIAIASWSASPTNGCCCTPTRSPFGTALTGVLNPGAMFGTGGSTAGAGGGGSPGPVTLRPVEPPAGPGFPPGPCGCTGAVWPGIGAVVGAAGTVAGPTGAVVGTGAGVVCAKAAPPGTADAAKMLALKIGRAHV